ncbi:MAG: methylated-DNA--[protein]-cysteine S-methyltransferase [Thaumarchaeota archaeon]|nr:methylated-DNA--[protein]-cysteine S-methyltransferase [Nitrososphaerota archaeon]
MNRQQRAIQSLCAYIGAHPAEELTLRTLSKRVGMSPSHLQRAFKRIVGVSPREYVEAVRLGKFRHLLREEGSVRRSTYRVGRSSTSWPYRPVGSVLGMEARAYRDGGAGERVRFATARCSLGFLLVAGTGRGVCFVVLDDSEEGAREELRREYPKADIREDRDSAGRWTRAVADSLEAGDSAGLESLPLDIRATAFQWKVWKCLVSIPRGSTTSYGELAMKVGSPNGARAVGNACWSNPLALVIPCHRVVASDGTLGGYRWGVGRKRAILRKEGARDRIAS